MTIDAAAMAGAAASKPGAGVEMQGEGLGTTGGVLAR